MLLATAPNPMGAGDSAVVVDLPRCRPILSPRVPNLVPIAGITRSAYFAVRALDHSLDQRPPDPPNLTNPLDQPHEHLEAVKSTRCDRLVSEHRHAA